MKHIIPISGKDSCATAIIQMARDPHKPYQFVFNDTGAEFDEVFEWLDKVETVLGKPIERVGESLDKIIEGYDILPSAQMRFCTKEAKVFPMNRWIGKDEPAMVYYGIRADEKRVGAGTFATKHITPIYPLVEMGAGIDLVLRVLKDRDLMPPAFEWKAMREMVEGILPDSSWIGELGEIEDRQLFSWRTRANCFYCFYQRRYEWIGLLDNKPHLYDRAQAMEEKYGGDDFTWVKGLPLKELRTRREPIMKKRAYQIADYIAAKHGYGRSFQRSRYYEPTIFGSEALIEDDPMALTSCGLMCGK